MRSKGEETIEYSASTAIREYLRHVALPPTLDDGGLVEELAAAKGVIAEWERDMKQVALEAERAKAKELEGALDQIKRLVSAQTISPGFCLPHIDEIAPRTLEKVKAKVGV